MSLENQRREYAYSRLTRNSLAASPFEQFKRWLDDALSSGISDPTAMSVATVGKGGEPWQRIVLLKYFDERGLVFYTNYGSRKAIEIANNARVCLLFPWLVMERQVIVGGVAEKVSVDESLKYFLNRPRESQLAAWASRQSAPLGSRKDLEAQFARMKEKFGEGDVPLPDFWGGFRVLPHEFEFWQGGEKRLHDRFQYLKDAQGEWQINRLAP